MPYDAYSYTNEPEPVVWFVVFVVFVFAPRQKGAEGGAGGDAWGAVEENVAFQFSLGPAKTAVLLTITEEVFVIFNSNTTIMALLLNPYRNRAIIYSGMVVVVVVDFPTRYYSRVKV